MDKHSENKITYINIQEINWLYASYNQHAYLLILNAYERLSHSSGK
jgi:hypothetical protein